MVGEPSKEELLEFMRKNYGPNWSDESKLELARALWKKKFGKEKSFTGQIVGDDDRKYVEKSIDEVKDRELVEVTGIVIDRDFFKYLGCPVCYKSVKNGCEHLNSGQVEPVELAISKVVISDGTGELNSTTLIKPGEEDLFEDIDIGYMIKIKGYSRIIGDEKRIYANDVSVVREVGNDDAGSENDSVAHTKAESNVLKIDDLDNPNAQSFLRYLINSGGMRREIAEMMMERKGISWDEIKDYIDFEDDMIVVKEGVI